LEEQPSFFSKVIHLVRDVLLVSPAASSAFISFLDKCEAISKLSLFPYLPDAVRTGAATRDPLQAREALSQSTSVQESTESRNLAQATASTICIAPLGHLKHPRGGGHAALRAVTEPETKRNRDEGALQDRPGKKGPSTRIRCAMTFLF
jgi:hypothetical protein